MKHFKSPVNAGEICNTSAVGESRDPANGNCVKIWLKIDEGIIKDISFKASGCVPLIASGSVVTGIARGRRVEEARDIGLPAVLEIMKGLPPDKIHAVILTLQALKDGLAKI